MIEQLNIIGNGRRKAAGALVFGVCAALIGCGGQGYVNTADSRENGGSVQEIVREVASARYPEQPVYRSAEERWEAERNKSVPEAFSEAYEGFSCATASELLKDEDSNMVYSPMSLYFVLAAAAEGADGETRKELLGLLGYSHAENLPADFKAAYEALYHGTDGGKENGKSADGDEELDPSARYQLRIYNSVWADRSADLKDTFAEHVSKYFYSDVYSADFKEPDTAAAMAGWVEERTDGLIKPEIRLDGQTVLSLMNTIYFYDEWVNRFDSKSAAPDLFHLSDGTDVTCDFMNMEMGSHGFTRGENYTASSLSLKNGSMVFYLPDEGTDVRELTSSPQKLRALLDGEGESFMGRVTWKVPKFSVECKLNLKESLTRLGLKHVFGGADFSAMTDTPVFVSNIIQEARVKINEEGVEAAAFTRIDYAGAALPDGTAEMILDRPFLYVIKNRGQILFIGICGNPAAE